MSERAAEATTTGMKGSYDAHSEYQRRVIEGGDQLIRDAVSGLDLDSLDGALTVVDYGAGTGATSAHAVGTALAAVRERDSERALQAIHNDVPSNDFSKVFLNATGEGGYLRAIEGEVYALAAAGSFFGQVIPSATAHLGMCSNAAHWLREQPTAQIPDGMYFSEATGEAREEIAEQAAGDWLAFLEARAAELAGGGRLLVQGIATTEDGEHVSASRLLRAMWRIATAMTEDGLLDRDALGRYVFPVYCRSPEEAMTPVTDGGPLADSFEVVSQEVEEVSNPYWEAYERDGNPHAYAATYVQFVRAFAESTMLANLFEPGARGIEPQALCDRYFARLEASTAADPEAGRYEAWILRLVLARR